MENIEEEKFRDSMKHIDSILIRNLQLNKPKATDQIIKHRKIRELKKSFACMNKPVLHTNSSMSTSMPAKSSSHAIPRVSKVDHKTNFEN